MINDYTIHDSTDMHMKTAFPIHEIDNMYTKRQFIYMFVIIYIVLQVFLE